MAKAAKADVIELRQDLTVFNQAQIAVLSQTSPPEMIQIRKGRGGTELAYLAHNYVTEILNSAFGHRWDFTVEVIEIVKDIECVVKGRLTVYGLSNQTIVKEQFGQQDFLKDRNGKVVMSIGDCLKGAGSDALRKCASLLGIGLDLYGRKKPEQKIVQCKTKLDEAKSLPELAAIWKRNYHQWKAELSAEDFADLTEYKEDRKDQLSSDFQEKQEAADEAKKPEPEYLITADQIDRIRQIVKPGGLGVCLNELEIAKLLDCGNNPNSTQADTEILINDAMSVIRQRESNMKSEMEGD